MLENGECVFLKTIFGKFEARLFREEFENPPARDFYFMPFSLASAKLIFKTENEELQALATLEKPSIILSPKGIFAAHFLHHARVILPYEPFLALLARFLESYQGFYLLPINDNTEKLENGICEFVECEQSPLCISVAKNGLIVPHTYRSSHPHAHLQTLQETMRAHKLERTNALYLGRNPTQFFVYFDGKLREALSFCFESNLGVIVATLESLNETTQSLLRNFTKENADLVARLRTLSRDSKESRNLLDLLGMVGVLLDLGTEEDLRDSCMQVLRVAGEFMGAKGPRIDFRLERNESGIFLNTLWTLRSVMSFKLAGVERELLCFGVLDSLAEFFANLSRDMNENYQTQDIVVCGELFLERQFLNQFVHYLPKTSEVYPSLVMEFVDS